MTLANRVVGRSALFIAALLLALVPSARAGWNANPVPVHGTTNFCAPLVSCADGARGAIVVWQEQGTAYAPGVLRAQHVLATGDVDPSWNGPVNVNSATAQYGALVAIGDGTGGAYVSWTSGVQFFVTHLDANGTRSSGWPIGGRMLGLLAVAGERPTLLADGTGGLYVAWRQSDNQIESSVQLVLAHLGPGNQAAGGFPPGAMRNVAAPTDTLEWVVAAGVGLAGDGGLWVVRGALAAIDPLNYDVRDGQYRVVKLTAAGLPASGWDARGVVLGSCRAGAMLNWNSDTPLPVMNMAAIADDGAGGSYPFAYAYVSGPLGTQPRLYHLDAPGTLMAGWPAAGVTPSNYALEYAAPNAYDDASLSMSAHPDQAGGVFAGYGGLFGSDSPYSYALDHMSTSHVKLSSSSLGGIAYSFRAVESGDGGMLASGCKTTGPYSMYEPGATIWGTQSGGGSYSEYHLDPVTLWYGDASISATGDGGSILAWSQVRERFGIYAVRLTPGGLDTGVPGTTASAPHFTLRFTHGVGLAADAAFAHAGEARLVLADVAGRALARDRFVAAAGARAWTLAGTAGLAPGLYFARLEQDARVFTAKVVVTH